MQLPTSLSENDSAFIDTLRAAEKMKAELEEGFFPTATYQAFRRRLFTVLEAREARMTRGLFQQKGAALLAPAGVGKTRLVKQAIAEFEAISEASGDRQFGYKVLSVTVPGRATFQETSKAILTKLGYPIHSARDEVYLTNKIVNLMEQQRFAGLHLDEFQDAGRYTTAENRRVFTKRFRNMMDDTQWPVCLILSGTLEGKEFINLDGTLNRRLKPIEVLSISFSSDGKVLRDAAAALLRKSGVKDELGLFAEDEFLKILIHASGYRFGVAIEIIIESIGEAMQEGESCINLEHFAEAYYVRSNCDDDLNPFMSRQWKVIDTTKIFERVGDGDLPLKKPCRRK
jgi:hypothetical protein